MKHSFKHKSNTFNKPKGLGDVVENVTKVTGIKSLMELGMKATGKKDCGCDKRKKWLNEKFPLNRNKK